MEEKTPIRILFFSGDEEIIRQFYELIKTTKFKPIVTYVPDSIKGVGILKDNQNFDVILLDLNIVSHNISFIGVIQEFGIPVIAIIGKDNEQIAYEAIQNGAQDCLIRNGVLNSIGLCRAIFHAIKRHKFQENKNNKGTFNQFNSAELINTTEELHRNNYQLRSTINEIGVINASFQNSSKRGVTR